MLCTTGCWGVSDEDTKLAVQRSVQMNCANKETKVDFALKEPHCFDMKSQAVCLRY